MSNETSEAILELVATRIAYLTATDPKNWELSPLCALLEAYEKRNFPALFAPPAANPCPLPHDHFGACVPAVNTAEAPMSNETSNERSVLVGQLHIAATYLNLHDCHVMGEAARKAAELLAVATPCELGIESHKGCDCRKPPRKFRIGDCVTVTQKAVVVGPWRDAEVIVELRSGGQAIIHGTDLKIRDCDHCDQPPQSVPRDSNE